MREVRKHWPLASKFLKASLSKKVDPFKLTFMVTRTCHSKCQNCNIWQARSNNELTLHEIKEFAVKNPRFRWINFTGGEPTDRDDLFDIVKTFKITNEELHLVNITSNGLNTKKIVSVVEQIVTLRLPEFYISISIDGPQKANDSIRGIEGDFELSIQTLNELMKLKKNKNIQGFNVLASTTLYSQNASLVKDTLESIQNLVPGFEKEQLQINIGHSSFQAYRTQVSDVDKVRSFENLSLLEVYPKGLALGIHQVLKKAFLANIKKYLESGKTPIDCTAIKNSIFLTETGDIYPCSIWDKKIGNIRDLSFYLKDVLRSDFGVSIRKNIEAKNCANCWSPCEAFVSLASSPINLIKYIF